MRRHQYCCSSVATGCFANSSAHPVSPPSAAACGGTVSAVGPLAVAAGATVAVAAALAQRPRLTVAAASTQTQHPSATRQHSTSSKVSAGLGMHQTLESAAYIVSQARHSIKAVPVAALLPVTGFSSSMHSFQQPSPHTHRGGDSTSAARVQAMLCTELLPQAQPVTLTTACADSPSRQPGSPLPWCAPSWNSALQQHKSDTTCV